MANKNKIIVTLSTDYLIKINPILQVTELKIIQHCQNVFFSFNLFPKVNISSVHTPDL